MPGTGSGNAQTFDVFQSGNCDNDALGLFSGTNVPITNSAVGSSGPEVVTGSNGNTYTLEWSGPNPDTYSIILVSQVASGPETLTFSYFFDDGSASPGSNTNGIFTVNVTLPALGPTVPGAPTIGTATAGDTQASVTFTAPGSDGGAAITGYNVTSSPGGFIGTGTTSPIVVVGLANGTAYTFTVTATNSVGKGSASAASNSVTPATVPGIPTIGTATAGNAQASITFTAPASNGGAIITGYTVTSAPSGFTGTGATSPIVVVGLSNGTAYTFTVTATNGVGTGPASAVSNSVTPATVPGVPTIGAATAGNGQANVAFMAPALNGGSTITGYTVTSSPGGVTATGTISPIAVAGLTNGTAYMFTVTATNSIGTSSASATSNSVTPATVPDAPTVGTATAGSAQASVAFTAPASDGGAAITGYTVTSSPSGFAGTGITSPILVAGLANGTAYTFTVTATNSIGTSSASGASNSITAAAVPDAPTIGTATAGNGQANITFTAPASNGGSAITVYTVTSSPGGFTGTGATSPITVAALTNGTAYTFTVTATNTNGTSTASAASNSVTPATVPGAPTIGTATGGNAQANVTFAAPASNGGAAITGYTVISSPGGLVGTGTASPIVVAGLTNGTAYMFTVTATNSVGTGTASAASNSITPTGSQTITFANPGTQNFGTTPTLTAISTSGLTVTFSSSTTSICTMTSGGALTTIAIGTCTINADQAGDSSVAAAPTLSRSFSIVAATPGAPTIGAATAGDGQANVTFTAPSFTGGTSIMGYIVTSSPGGITATGLSSPITVTGLTNGTSYTFTVVATNSAGAGSASASSNSITATPAPSGPAQTANASAAVPATMHVTAHATSGPFTGITIVTPPSSGRAVVNGLNVIYIPDPTITTTQVVTFTYTLTNASGISAPITVTVTVSPSTQKVSQLETPPRWRPTLSPPIFNRVFGFAGGAA
jgi:hypothetical protein